jgi:hypothetical protein
VLLLLLLLLLHLRASLVLAYLRNTTSKFSTKRRCGDSAVNNNAFAYASTVICTKFMLTSAVQPLAQSPPVERGINLHVVCLLVLSRKAWPLLYLYLP